MEITTATKDKSIRAKWDGGTSRVSILFYGKGPQKSQVTVDHMKLASTEGCAKMKAYWFEALNRLEARLNPETYESRQLYDGAVPPRRAARACSDRGVGFFRVPARLEGQPYFYPVQNEEYAVQNARDWNAKNPAIGGGFVTRFRVRTEYLTRFDVKTVGSAIHKEYWVPAGDLPEFNRNIVGKIEVIAEFKASQNQ